MKSIVLSGLPCAGKSTLLKRLQDHFGWKVYSFGDILRAEHEKLHPDGKPSFEDWWPTVPVEKLREMNIAAQKFYDAGNMLGDSRYAHYCTKCWLIFLTAPREVRARRALQTERYKDKTVDEMIELFKKREADEIARGKELWGEDYNYTDPALYHLVLNTDNLSVDEEFKLVLSLVTE